MPEDLFWIKASTPENTAAISEVIGIHAQAALSTALLTPANDLLRLDKGLDARSIALKLAEARFQRQKRLQQIKNSKFLREKTGRTRRLVHPCERKAASQGSGHSVI